MCPHLVLVKKTMTNQTAKRIVIEVNAVGHVVFDEGHLTEQHWITVQIGGGWMVAFRVTSVDVEGQRRARIVELRLVPTDSPARFGLDWSYEYYKRLAKRNGRTIGPFPFDAIRRIITARHLDDALAAAASRGLRDDLPSRGETRRRRSGGGRPGRPLAFYARLAIEFDRLENHPRRERGLSTRAVLANRHDVPVSTIGKWIRICRRKKLLTSVIQGRRGGRATDLAKELYSGGKK